MANASTGHYAPLHREQRLDDMDERIKREGLSAFGMDNDPAKWRQGLVEKEPRECLIARVPWRTHSRPGCKSAVPMHSPPRPWRKQL